MRIIEESTLAAFADQYPTGRDGVGGLAANHAAGAIPAFCRLAPVLSFGGSGACGQWQSGRGVQRLWQQLSAGLRHTLQHRQSVSAPLPDARGIRQRPMERRIMKTLTHQTRRFASYADIPKTYRELCGLYLPRPIHDDAQDEEATAMMLRARGLHPAQRGATGLPRRADGICGRIRQGQKYPLAESQRAGRAQIPVGRKRNERGGFVAGFWAAAATWAR